MINSALFANRATPATNDAVEGLNVANLSKPRDKQESQTISSLYNLLQDNDQIRWNGTEIKIRPPQGLTTINKINFRSFTGDLLPYTSLDLPELNISLKVFTSSGFDGTNTSIYLIGDDNTEGIEPKHAVKDEQDADDTSKNIITTFNKAWTYDSTAESQIEYNIAELVNYLNECLLSWFGPTALYYKFGVFNNDKWDDYDLQGNIIEDVGGQLITHDVNNNVDYYYIDENNQLAYKTITMKLSYSPFNGVCCADNGLIYAHSGGLQWNSYNFYNLNTNSFVFSNKWEQHYPSSKIFKNYDYPVAFTPTYAVISPHVKTSSKSNRTFELVRASDNQYMKTTFDVSLLPSQYANFVICGINETSTTSLVVYTLGQLDSSSSTALDLIPFNLYIDDTTNTFTISVNTDDIINNIITIDDYQKFNMFELNNGITYNTMKEITYGGNNRYLCFDGKVIIKIDGDDNKKGIVYLHTYKVNQNGETFYLTQSGPCYNGNFDVPMYKRAEESIWLGFNVEYAYNNHHYPGLEGDYYVETSYPILSIKSLTDTEQQLTYYQNGKITNFEKKQYFKYFQCYYYVNGQKTLPLNTINEHITYNDVLFEYKDGQISFPSIAWSNTNFITFVPVITTNPRYFNIKFDIPQSITLSDDYSIIQTDEAVNFHQLNNHVFTTLETLLLLKYEYNDLMLRVNNFPNTDNFVFSINETCNVAFKKMNSNSNNQELNINLCDSSGNAINYETIKRLYGKVILAIDWEQA